MWDGNCSLPAVRGNNQSSDVNIVPMVTATGASTTCLLPQYHIFTWILAMMALASFLKLHYLIKTAMLVVVVTVYTTLMMVAFPGLFSQFQASSTTKVYLAKDRLLKVSFTSRCDNEPMFRLNFFKN